jgi:hypothetical protein
VQPRRAIDRQAPVSIAAWEVLKRANRIVDAISAEIVKSGNSPMREAKAISSTSADLLTPGIASKRSGSPRAALAQSRRVVPIYI